MSVSLDGSICGMDLERGVTKQKYTFHSKAAYCFEWMSSASDVIFFIKFFYFILFYTESLRCLPLDCTMHALLQSKKLRCPRALSTVCSCGRRIPIGDWGS